MDDYRFSEEELDTIAKILSPKVGQIVKEDIKSEFFREVGKAVVVRFIQVLILGVVAAGAYFSGKEGLK